MAEKNGILFLYSLLIILIFSIIPGAAGSSDKNFNIPVYINSSAGIEKANFDNLENILLYHRFTIERMQEYVPDEKCSLRAEEGSFEIDGEAFYRNDLSFNIPLRNDGPGQGSFVAQRDGDDFRLDFEVQQILETNADRLVFRAIGWGKLGKEELSFDKIIVSYDKINNKAEITGSGDKDFKGEELEVTFVKWCSGQKTDFYLILEINRLEEPRTIEEIDELLEQYPQLIDVYEGLRSLSIPAIPEFGLIATALAIIGSIGLFFIVRRK